MRHVSDIREETKYVDAALFKTLWSRRDTMPVVVFVQFFSMCLVFGVLLRYYNTRQQDKLASVR